MTSSNHHTANGHSKHKNGYLLISNGSVKHAVFASSAPSTLRFRRLLLFCLCSALLFFFGYSYYCRNSADYAIFYNVLSATASTNTCPIPQPDPWDPTIEQYLSKPNALICKRLQPELTYLTDDGWLRFNVTAMREEGYSKLNCQFRCFDRKENTDDDTLEYQDWTPFENESKISNCEFIEVSCSKTFPSVSIYTNLHNQIIPKLDTATIPSRNSNQRLASEPEAQPSVLIFVLDSVSHSNFIRQLPKTFKFLTESLGTTVFSGFTKVGDNSFPNAAAMFAGKRVCVAGYESEMQEDMSKTFFDDWPLIWKDFKKAGYVTFYAEDYPNFNLFNYLAIGFKRKPVDHYFRPYWLALWWSFLHRRSTHLCYGNARKHNLQLNYLRQFWLNYPTRPKFAINWLTELSHDWLNQVALGDDDLLRFFQHLQPLLNNTILFLLSDHGHRFDAIRESVIGRVEERMPFFSVTLPPWMRQKYPRLDANLRNNSGLLTSPFDLHASLLDILDDSAWRSPRPSSSAFADQIMPKVKIDNSHPNSLANESSNSNKDFRKNAVTARGLSLFRPLPRDRTCEMARIPEDFCVCQQETTVNIGDRKVVRAAEVLIDSINELLNKHGSFTVCSTLRLKEIKNAQLVLPNLKTVLDPQASFFFHGGSNPSGFFLNYRVTVQAAPSDAVFEATLRNSGRDDSFAVFGDINRINRYGNQSYCVSSALLRKYCFCK